MRGHQPPAAHSLRHLGGPSHPGEHLQWRGGVGSGEAAQSQADGGHADPGTLGCGEGGVELQVSSGLLLTVDSSWGWLTFSFQFYSEEVVTPEFSQLPLHGRIEHRLSAVMEMQELVWPVVSYKGLFSKYSETSVILIKQRIFRIFIPTDSSCPAWENQVFVFSD